MNTDLLMWRFPILFVCICATGCSTVTSQTFTRGAIQSKRLSLQYDSQPAARARFGTIKVCRFTESRTRQRVERENLWLSYIPIACMATYWERSDWMFWESDQSAYKPVGLDMAETIRNELESSGLFKTVLAPGDEGSADWIIEGDVQKLSFMLRPHLCGVSLFLAPFIGVFGAPLGQWSVDQRVRLKLVSSGDASTLWEKSIDTQAKGYMAAYYGGNPIQFGYPYDEAMRPIIDVLFSILPNTLTEVSGKEPPIKAEKVENRKMVDSRHEKAATTTSNGTGLALIIGINKYDQMGGLNNCRQDAVEVANMLVQRAGYTRGRVLIHTDDAEKAEERASFTAVTRRIGQVCSLAKPEDVLMIYFAGHGITINGQSYLVPLDGGETQTSISIRWLQSQMEASKAKSKILILDACHSGRAVRGVEGIAPSLIGVENLVTITSCADSELSYPNGEHGVFTEYLLSGLDGPADNNKDGKITNYELFQYIQNQMESWCLKTGKTQRPQMFPLSGLEVPLSTIP